MLNAASGAKANVSIYVVSTRKTDYFLVHSPDVNMQLTYFDLLVIMLTKSASESCVELLA
jgi:hypothetical protein